MTQIYNKNLLVFSILIQIGLCYACSGQKQFGDKWEILFDGETLTGWHEYNKKNQPVMSWIVEDGALVCLGTAPDAPNGSLVTDKHYDNFILDWEWKIDSGSNSGVFYHVIEDSIKYKKGPHETGPEYQIIDDKNFPGKLEDWQQTGANYAMYPANGKKKINELGNWNASRIIYNKGYVAHYLNGMKIVEFDADSEDWLGKRDSGKWKGFPDYAVVRKGAIALQNHNSKAYFRNIKIKKSK